MHSKLSLSSLRPTLLIAVALCPGTVIHGQAPSPVPSAASADVPTPGSTSAAPRPTRDDGLLDPAWFSPDDLELREHGKLDYFWVRPGFTLEGRTLQFMPWTAPVLSAERDEKDRSAAKKIHENFPPRLAEAFAAELAGTAKVVQDDGDLRVLGRVVDCNAGNIFAYVWPNFTFELKFIGRDGTLQVALHTRFVGGASKANLGSWAKMIAKPFAAGIEGVWRAAEPSGP